MNKSTRLIITAAAITGLYAGSLASKSYAADDKAGVLARGQEIHARLRVFVRDARQFIEAPRGPRVDALGRVRQEGMPQRRRDRGRRSLAARRCDHPHPVAVALEDDRRGQPDHPCAHDGDLLPLSLAPR